MKKAIVGIVFILVSLLSISQEECKDVIHPTKGESIIFDCCIDEVKDGNVVYFTKNGESHIVAAVAIIKNGMEIPLTEYSEESSTQPPQIQPEAQKEYNLYQAKYLKAKKSRNTGAAFTALGVSFTLVGALVANNNVNFGAGLVIGGFFCFNIGFPVWMAGAAKTRANRKAMERVKRNSPGLKSISIGPTNDGFGLTFNL